MANTLATILDDADNRALVEKYLEKTFLERRDYDTVLANSTDAQTFRIPEQGGQYVECTRKGRFRRPENVPTGNETADPASGAEMGVEKLKLPIEFIHEYIAVSTIAQMTSWVDLVEWANEDLPMALKRRFHELTQNAFKVGRFRPGVWAANGTASTAFDTVAAASSVSMYGLTFDFDKAPAYFAGGKSAFAAMVAGDRPTMDDCIRIRTRLLNAGAQKINGRIVAVISEAMQMDLMKDDKYFRAACEAWSGKGLADGVLCDYMGIHWKLDDEPFTEDFGNALVRASNGPIHTAEFYGKSAFAYLKLGSKSKMKPTFKVQDITKTGGEKTIGYLIPFQAGISYPDWCATYTAPVSEWEANNA